MLSHAAGGNGPRILECEGIRERSCITRFMNYKVRSRCSVAGGGLNLQIYLLVS